MDNFLTRLELQGFKSFAGKTILEFPSQVTAIVGPNGSGKSNVIDAVRWVLGEREAKQLRGETLDNLIFAGTPKKPAMSLARVGLYFNNNKKNLSVDAPEVTLARRIDRSGNSEFSLNDGEIKLKDLLPMLAKARLGTRGLMIIGQGQSDIFVRSSPEDRRLMIEEVLGLREYRIKKNQAERRLESSEINMEKVKAMLEELAPHVRILRRQRSRFLRRTEIEEELKTLEDAYFYVRYRDLEKGLKDVEEPVSKLRHELEVADNGIAIKEKELKEIGGGENEYEKAKEIREKINSILNRKNVLGIELAKLEARLEFQKKVPQDEFSAAEVRSLLSDFSKEGERLLGVDDISEIKASLKGWLSKFRKVFQADKGNFDEKILSEQKRMEKEMAELEAAVKNFREEDEALAQKQQKANQLFRDKVEELNQEKNRAHALEQRIQSHVLEKERLHMKLEELEREWQALGRDIHDLRRLSEPEGVSVVKESDWAEAERKMMRLRGELAAIGEIDPNLMKEAEESEQRFDFLTKQLSDLEKASVDLKMLIKDLDQRIHEDFKKAFHTISEEFNNYFRLMFGGGKAKLSLEVKKPPALVEGENNESVPTEEKPASAEASAGKKPDDLDIGVEVDVNLPRKRITSLEMLSGGEKTLVSLAALFALIAVSPPPFLILDEIDAALDEENARRFAELIQQFRNKTQFVIVTHNRATMEAADVLYGVTMGEDGVSKVLSLKLEG
ncbi:MAG: AAA family ATPase [Minisyncoccia bacterium]|jgi:chromosome segregation protein